MNFISILHFFNNLFQANSTFCNPVRLTGIYRALCGRNIVFALLIATLAFGVAGCELQPADSQPLTSSQQVEYETLNKQLTDPQRSNETRQDAARLLLTKTYPKAAELLYKLLEDSSRPATQISIADAIAEEANCPQKFADPLFKMLDSTQVDSQLAAARALATTQQDSTLDKLLAILKDPKTTRTQKLAIITAIQRNYDRKSIKALIRLLSNKDSAIRNAAAGSLKKITGIESFGSDKRRWEMWWSKHRFQTRQQWLEELASNLTKNRLTMERHNSLLSDRLTKTLEELYNTAPAARKPEMILAMLNDSLAEVRLLGLNLAIKMLDSGKPLTPEITNRITALIFDRSFLVRQQAASLQSETNPKNATEILMGRLSTETYPTVRVAILEELGQLKSPRAINQIISSIASPDAPQAAAAARALGLIAENNKFSVVQKIQADRALTQRYKKAQNGHNALELRESILSTMGILGTSNARDIFIKALKSDSGAIRLAAVTGLTRLQNSEDAATLLPFTKDEDRGVRHAAVKAVGQLGDQTYLDDLIRLASPKLESDPSVRKEAMKAAVALCQKADPKTLVKSLAIMKKQQQIDSQLKIELLQQYANYLATQNSPRKLTVDIELAEEYVQVGNVSQAQILLEKSLQAATKLGKKSPVNPTIIWNRLIRLMIDSGNTAALKNIASQKDKKSQADAVIYLVKWFKSPASGKNLLTSIAMADGALTQLGKILTKPQAAELRKFMVSALAKQQKIDTASTNRLLEEYLKGETKIKEQALQQIKAMAERAHKPLLIALRNELTSKKPSKVREAGIANLIKQIMPKLGDYVATEPTPQKLARVDKLLAGMK